MSLQKETEDTSLQKPVIGTYNATIKDVEIVNGKRYKVEFEVETGDTVMGYFPLKATRNNKTGWLFDRAIGDYSKSIDYCNFNTDELIGKKVEIVLLGYASCDTPYHKSFDIPKMEVTNIR